DLAPFADVVELPEVQIVQPHRGKRRLEHCPGASLGAVVRLARDEEPVAAAGQDGSVIALAALVGSSRLDVGYPGVERGCDHGPCVGLVAEGPQDTLTAEPEPGYRSSRRAEICARKRGMVQHNEPAFALHPRDASYSLRARRPCRCPRPLRSPRYRTDRQGV